MRDTTITILRGGNDLVTNVLTGVDGRKASGIFVQVDQASDREMLDARDISGFYGKVGFKITTLYWNVNALIKQDDILVDERYGDPDSGASYRYHVVGRPKDYQFGHQEILCDVPVGT